MSSLPAIALTKGKVGMLFTGMDSGVETGVGNLGGVVILVLGTDDGIDVFDKDVGFDDTISSLVMLLSDMALTSVLFSLTLSLNALILSQSFTTLAFNLNDNTFFTFSSNGASIRFFCSSTSINLLNIQT